MAPKGLCSVVYGILAGSIAVWSLAWTKGIEANGLRANEARPVYSGLTAHEWGTFTSIAGEQGQAVEWSPLTGSTDLPAFVEHLRTPQFKLGLRGTVRMETPVLYFYDSREETVSVKVSFEHGLITEWYPHASRVEPSGNLGDVSRYLPEAGGSIAWDTIATAPTLRADFPRGKGENHYYAARGTSATPLCVKTPSGEQHEKFLFYRGVGAFAPPVSARLTADGKLQVENHGEEEIPNVILFERRGENVGYRIGGGVQDKSLVEAPELTGSVDSLGRELEGMLVNQGLYQDEAHAMIETWRSSWFEEGSRVLYLVPAEFVNRVLPLSITPAPVQTARVFVGRLEVVTPATVKAVEEALVAHDRAAIELYGRFLEPILQTIMTKEKSPERLRQIQEALSNYYSSEVSRNLGTN
jgi:hypothetical protein